MRAPLILAAALLSASSVVMASDWSRDVSYSGNNDPGEIWFSDGTQVHVEYKEIPWETVDAWPQGKALRLEWSADTGIELVDIASKQRMSAMFESAAAHPIDLLAEQCMQEPPYDDAGCLDAAHQRWDREVNRAYDVLLKRLAAKSDRERVRAAQRFWAAYRDAQIAAIGQIIGGTEGTIWSNVSKREINQLLREQQRRLERMTNLWLRP